jgi:hypothetical protein
MQNALSREREKKKPGCVELPAFSGFGNKE